MAPQIKSRQRVADHGEVFTGPREVEAMLDLVRQETERIDSRFLEPACGDGNFLTPILERKLAVVERRYRRSQLELERYAVLAVSSLYGIDILPDNIAHCRERLLGIFDAWYRRLFPDTSKDACRATVAYILERNIVWGDALTMLAGGSVSEPIVFPEWSFIRGSLVKRRDFAFRTLLRRGEATPSAEPPNGGQLALFAEDAEEVSIPTPVKDYPPVHFLGVADVQP